MSQANPNNETTLTGKRKLEEESENSSSDEDEESLFLPQGFKCFYFVYYKFNKSNCNNGYLF